MSDNTKLELISQMIGNYYEFCIYSKDDISAKAGAMDALIVCIDVVASYRNAEKECDGECCCHGGDCMNGAE